MKDKSQIELESLFESLNKNRSNVRLNEVATGFSGNNPQGTQSPVGLAQSGGQQQQPQQQQPQQQQQKLTIEKFVNIISNLLHENANVGSTIIDNISKLEETEFHDFGDGLFVDFNDGTSFTIAVRQVD